MSLANLFCDCILNINVRKEEVPEQYHTDKCRGTLQMRIFFSTTCNQWVPPSAERGATDISHSLMIYISAALIKFHHYLQVDDNQI